MLGGAAVGLWLISQIATLYEAQRSAADNADDALLRMAYAVLRLMESSPSGLVPADVKITLCQFLVQAFTRMDQRYGRESGYFAAVETASDQIKTLEQRKDQSLPHFEDAERILEGQKALPRFQQMLIQLRDMGFIDADACKHFMAELKHRHTQLESDAHVVRAKRARSYNDTIGATRYFQSARSTLLRLPDSDDKTARLSRVESLAR
jgi:hypothetical protein